MAELVRSYLNRVVAVWVVRVVATSLAVALDAMNASVVMVLVAAVAYHAVDRPFSVNPNPKCHNRVADVVIVRLFAAAGDDDGDVHGCDVDDDARNSNNETMECHFPNHRRHD